MNKFYVLWILSVFISALLGLAAAAALYVTSEPVLQLRMEDGTLSIVSSDTDLVQLEKGYAEFKERKALEAGATTKREILAAILQAHDVHEDEVVNELLDDLDRLYGSKIESQLDCRVPFWSKDCQRDWVELFLVFPLLAAWVAFFAFLSFWRKC